MGAPGTHARKPGTGQIRCVDGKYAAILPSIGKKREIRLGTFPSKYEASRALDRWLAQQRQGGP
jgi:hypothetical protein